jgi:hypothetical protein
MLGNDGFTDIVFSFSTKAGGKAFTTLIEPAMDKVSPIGRTLTQNSHFSDVFFLQTGNDSQTIGLLHAEQENTGFSLKNYDAQTGKSDMLLKMPGSLIGYYPLGTPESNFLHFIVLYENEGKTLVSIEKTDQTYFKFF